MIQVKCFSSPSGGGNYPTTSEAQAIMLAHTDAVIC